MFYRVHIRFSSITVFNYASGSILLTNVTFMAPVTAFHTPVTVPTFFLRLAAPELSIPFEAGLFSIFDVFKWFSTGTRAISGLTYFWAHILHPIMDNT